MFRRLLEAAVEFPLLFLPSLVGLDPDDEEAVNEVFAGAAEDFVARVVSIVENGLVEVEGLDPPDRFEEDHNRFIAGLREIWRLRLEGLDAAIDAALEADSDFETGLDELHAEAVALEAALTRELSPEFRALVGSFLGDADVEAPPSLADLIGDENITVTQGDVSISVSEQLPDDFPEALIPPAATFWGTVSWEKDGLREAVVTLAWQTEQEPSEVLDFYEEALVEAGYVGEQEERTDIPGFNLLNVLDADGEPIAVVLVAAANGTTIVTLSLVDF